MNEISDLYIMPSFFQKINSQENDDAVKKIQNKYNDGNYDQYTEIKSTDHSFNILLSFRKVRFIPLSESTIDYYDDDWDFSKYNLINRRSKFHFGKLTEPFKSDLKDMVLLQILKGGKKLTSVSNFLQAIRKFFLFLIDLGCPETKMIDISDVEKFLSTLDNSSVATYYRYIDSIRMFMGLYDSEYGTNILTREMSDLLKRDRLKEYNAAKEAQKRHPIPKSYLNKLLKCLFDKMNDPNETVVNRALAGMLIIDSQTGLRVSELSLLRTSSVTKIKIGSDVCYKVDYDIIKTARGNAGTITCVTYFNEIAYTAFNKVVDLLKDIRESRNTDYLMCGTRKLPYDRQCYIKFLKKICIENYEELETFNPKWKDVLAGDSLIKNYLIDHCNNAKDYRDTPLKDIPNINNDTHYYYPICHQFRNTVIDELLHDGVPIEYVQQYMGHFSRDMTDGYANYGSKKDLQENMEYTEQTLKTFLSGEAKIIGPNGDSIANRVNEWLEENNLNVNTDLNEIVSKLSKIIPIRAKTGGMCIKGSKLTYACSLDAKTDEFMCACGICPNICHFYFMADVAYSEYKALKNLYQYNLDNGFKRQAQKERNKIKNIIINTLKPELEETEKEIKKHGKDTIVYKHPQMEYIVNHLKEIEGELEQWIRS